MNRILWDVDTQVDFMEPSGKLYVPNANEVAPAMERLGSVMPTGRASWLRSPERLSMTACAAIILR